MKAVKSISRSVEIGLRVVGVWPGMSYAVVHRIFWFVTLGMAQTFQYRHVAMHIGVDDPSHLMDGLSTTMCYSLLYIKLIIFWANRRTFYDILSSMAADWNEIATEHDVNIRPMTEMAYLSRRSSNIIIGLFSISVPFYAAGVIVSQQQMSNEGDDQVKEFFLKMELPFESDVSPIYEIVMVTQLFHQLAITTIAGVLNALVVTLILHVSGQIDLICQAFVEITVKSRQNSSSASMLSLLIGKHQKVIKFSNSIENLFSYIALMQFLWNTLVICAVGFIIVSSLDNEEGSVMLVKSLFFYLAIALEAFIFCYAGEYLSEKGRMISDAAYNSAWYDLKQREIKLLLILIMRSQKGLTITIGKFMDLSLARFTTIIKASASYISVLKAMN